MHENRTRAFVRVRNDHPPNAARPATGAAMVHLGNHPLTNYTRDMTLSAPSRTVPDLSYLLTHSGYVLATRMTAAFAELGITPRAYCVLFHARETERTQAELAAISDLDKTTMV